MTKEIKEQEQTLAMRIMCLQETERWQHLMNRSFADLSAAFITEMDLKNEAFFFIMQHNLDQKFRDYQRKRRQEARQRKKTINI